MPDLGADTVPALVAAAAAGDQGAWNELVARYTPLLASVVRRHRLSAGDAQDVMQTVWLRLVEHLDGLRDPRALPGWILTTARNESLRTLKARRASVPTDRLDERPPGADDMDMDAPMLQAERHEALLSALAELPRRQRELLMLLIEDPPLPYDEISRRLDMPVGSIGPTRARALARIREHPAVCNLMST